MLFHSLFFGLRRTRRTTGRPNAARIRLDSLEDRTAPATGTVQFQSALGSGTEGANPPIALVLVTDNFDLNGPVSADIAATGNGDQRLGLHPFRPPPSRSNGRPFAIVGGNRVYTKTAPWPTDDQRVEGSETIVLGVSNLVLGGADGIALGSPLVQTFTLLDNDSALVTYSGTAAVTEGGGSADVTATLSLVTTGTGTIGLDTPVSTTITSATADFTAATATWAAGEAAGAKPVAVTAIDDRQVEATVENLTGTLSVTTLANSATAGTAAVDVTDNDSAAVSITGSTTGRRRQGVAERRRYLDPDYPGQSLSGLAVPSARPAENADYTAAVVSSPSEQGQGVTVTWS